MMDVKRIINTLGGTLSDITDVYDRPYGIAVQAFEDHKYNNLTLTMVVESDFQEVWLTFQSTEQFCAFVEDLRLLALQVGFKDKTPV